MAALACTPTQTCAASAVAAEVSVSPSGMAAVTLELTVRLTDETPSSTIPVRFHLFQPQTAHRPPEYVSEHPYAAGAEVVYEGQRWRNESGQTLRRPPGSRPTAWAPLGPALPLAPPPPLAVAETVRLDDGDGNVLVKRQTVRPAAAAQRRFDHARRAAGRSAALTTRTDGGVVVELDRVAVGAAGGAAATVTLEWRGRLADQPLQGTRRLSQLAFVFPETNAAPSAAACCCARSRACAARATAAARLACPAAPAAAVALSTARAASRCISAISARSSSAVAAAPARKNTPSSPYADVAEMSWCSMLSSVRPSRWKSRSPSTPPPRASVASRGCHAGWCSVASSTSAPFSQLASPRSPRSTPRHTAQRFLKVPSSCLGVSAARRRCPSRSSASFWLLYGSVVREGVRHLLHLREDPRHHGDAGPDGLVAVEHDGALERARRLRRVVVPGPSSSWMRPAM